MALKLQFAGAVIGNYRRMYHAVFDKDCGHTDQEILDCYNEECMTETDDEELGKIVDVLKWSKHAHDELRGMSVYDRSVIISMAEEQLTGDDGVLPIAKEH